MGFEYRRDASGVVVLMMDTGGRPAAAMSPARLERMSSMVARPEAREGGAAGIFQVSRICAGSSEIAKGVGGREPRLGERG